MQVINGNVICAGNMSELAKCQLEVESHLVRKWITQQHSCFGEYLSYHGGSTECVFYKVSGKMALTQVCTRFLPQLCSALVSNSHPSDSDSAWPRTIFSHRVQFHLTGCILPLMHLTVACSLFSLLHPLPLCRSRSCLNSFFLHTPPITRPFLLSLFTVCYSNSLSICAHKFFTQLPSHNLIIRSKKQKNVLLLPFFSPWDLHSHVQSD